jgi:tRNA-modifying protein YgfZ
MKVTSLGIPSTEYEAVTAACGLVDQSERGKLALTGAEAKSFLQGQVSNDIEALTPGTGCYAAFLTPKGKMLGDLRVLDAGPLEPVARSASGLAGTGDARVIQLLLDTERVALQELFNMIRRFSVGYAVELHKRTVQSGLLSLVGPEAATVAGVSDLGQAEHWHVAGELEGIAVRWIRTDVGVDLLCEAGDTEALAAALQRRGAQPVSEAVADCLRIEHGRPRYGVDLDDTVIPQEADLNGRAVSFTKGCYVGQETVARLFYRGKPNRHLRGLRLSKPAETGAEITFGDRAVGRLGSIAESPSFGPIALALVRREAEPGSHVRVGSDEIDAVVVELPFSG